MEKYIGKIYIDYGMDNFAYIGELDIIEIFKAFDGEVIELIIKPKNIKRRST